MAFPELLYPGNPLEGQRQRFLLLEVVDYKHFG